MERSLGKLQSLPEIPQRLLFPEVKILIQKIRYSHLWDKNKPKKHTLNTIKLKLLAVLLPGFRTKIYIKPHKNLTGKQLYSFMKNHDSEDLPSFFLPAMRQNCTLEMFSRVDFQAISHLLRKLKAEHHT